ncbi:hypothetical protein ZOSMA_91G00450 [Zostera marina]|uniref:Uncharacterized protein n=1 Tax=Zostera marina TaxID=29655 RepID=A0A0K9NJ38_ZOSMR|nr:hypothetical protein ZOSMA_91G00450 [Zostera marina]
MASFSRSALVLRRAIVSVRYSPPSPIISRASQPLNLLRPSAFTNPFRILAADFDSFTFSRLTDTRYPKRRPSMRSRKKRAATRPKGPFAWVMASPDEPVPESQPNEGSIKARGRNRKKRARQRISFMASEVRKRKEAFAVHKRKKAVERIERKMAAVARDKAWAERLIELKAQEKAKQIV